MSVPQELRGRWNHNTHYYPLALAATPCRRALDVGCGEGLLLQLLAARCQRVVGVDPWGAAAKDACAARPNVRVLVADFLTADDPDLQPQSFDLVTSVAAIHHMDFANALRRMVDLTAPGGRLVVVGLTKETPLSWPRVALGVVPHRVMAWRRGYWKHTAPIAEPGQTWSQVRRTVRSVVPDARLRQHLYWRYSITWTRPA